MTKCPICNKPTNPEFKPFCSQRCADVDLGRWLTESYTLPAKPAIEEAEDAE
ncbi:MAG: DNA gyrase inhibitor YacG [Acidocella sp. 20-57-95]|nr:MAG: DNA gyrase inhibitor YacG [Acidocella sp. 20-57-95]HQT65074.1 DNA gyrase inhibitor YacG [Acidocella sp.]